MFLSENVALTLACLLMCFRVILTDLWNMSQSNGHGDWRRKEAASLSELVQNRIKFLQVSVPHVVTTVAVPT